MNRLPVTVYTPSSALTRPRNLNLIVQMFSDLWRRRELACRLFVRDTAALYRQSMLGYIWAFLPLRQGGNLGISQLSPNSDRGSDPCSICCLRDYGDATLANFGRYTQQSDASCRGEQDHVSEN